MGKLSAGWVLAALAVATLMVRPAPATAWWWWDTSAVISTADGGESPPPNPVMSGLSGDNAILNGEWVLVGTDNHNCPELDGDVVTNQYQHSVLGADSVLSCTDVMVHLEEEWWDDDMEEGVVFFWVATGEEEIENEWVMGFTFGVSVWDEGPFTLEAINALTTEFDSEWDDDGCFQPGGQ